MIGKLLLRIIALYDSDLATVKNHITTTNIRISELEKKISRLERRISALQPKPTTACKAAKRRGKGRRNAV